MNECPFCNYTGEFIDFGAIRRIGVRCPNCGSLERHRLLYLFLRDKVASDFKVLHFAPEGGIFDHLFTGEYHKADINPRLGLERIDMTHIPYPDDYFDLVLSCDVLEHIPNDIQAMKESYRVLKKNGFAVHLVPMRDEPETYEDFSITSPLGRLKAFGQEDHVRIYGRDYKDRLESVGFDVIEFDGYDLPEKYKIQSIANGVMHRWIYQGVA